MRFAHAHKLSSYVTIAVAMIALVSGGGVAMPLGALAIAGLIGSWWWEEPRVETQRWGWLFTAVAVLAFGWAAVSAIASGDYLGDGAGFVAVLTVARAYTRHAAKDWLQLYLLSFLMLVAGSVLSGGLGNLINDLQGAGHGRQAQSWVRTGPNEDIAPGDLEQALGGLFGWLVNAGLSAVVGVVLGSVIAVGVHLLQKMGVLKPVSA